MTKELNKSIKEDERFEFNKIITEYIYNYEYSYAAIENREIIGFIYAAKILGQKSIIVLAINVRNDKKNRGIGKRLLDFIEKRAMEDGITEILLFYEENEKLNSFYKNNGFDMGNNMRAIIKEL